MNKPTPPQMPDVIYAVCNDKDFGMWLHLPAEHKTSYTRTDLFEELKDKYEGGVWHLKSALEYARAITHSDECAPWRDCKCRICEALTKAQGLLR